MKRLLLLPLLVIALNSFAGWEMLFCDSVDNTGNCVGKAETFNLAGRLNVLLLNPDGLRTTKVYFEVYKVDPATFMEDLVTTEEVNTTAEANKVAAVLKPGAKGNYLIKARNAYKDYITSRELVIN